MKLIQSKYQRRKSNLGNVLETKIIKPGVYKLGLISFCQVFSYCLSIDANPMKCLSYLNLYCIPKKALSFLDI